MTPIPPAITDEELQRITTVDQAKVNILATGQALFMLRDQIGALDFSEINEMNPPAEVIRLYDSLEVLMDNMDKIDDRLIELKASRIPRIVDGPPVEFSLTGDAAHDEA